MPRIGPIKRNDLVQYLHRLGFNGPFPGGKHLIMRRGDISLRIPNLHRGDISVDMLLRLLRQAGIQRDEWEAP